MSFRSLLVSCRVLHPAVLLPLLALASPLGTTQAQQTLTTTILHTFPKSGSVGNLPSGLVQGSDSNFYGVTASLGSGLPASIYQLTPDGVFATLYALDPATDGTAPAATLVEGPDGAFYGVTTDGGTSSDGSIFRFTTDGEFSTIFSFDSTHGYTPNGPLIVEADGTLYGTTQLGGPVIPAGGVAFELPPDGPYKLLDSFVGVYNAKVPVYGLIRGIDGNFYGVTAEAGILGGGAVIQIAPKGGAAVLHTFGYAMDGSHPAGALVQTPDGTLYGATSAGGAKGFGTLFSITPDGSTYAKLHDFAGGAGGGSPVGGLVLANDGNLYGVTTSGGKDGHGMFFQLSPAGAFRNMFSFTSKFGGSPTAPLIQGTDGTLYGTTSRTVFQVDLGLPVLPTLVLTAFDPTAVYKAKPIHDGEFAVYLTEATTVDLTVNYTLAGTALNGSDYKTLSGVLTIPAGDTYGLIEVVPTAKLKGQGAQTVVLTLAPGSGYTIQGAAPATVTAVYK